MDMRSLTPWRHNWFIKAWAFPCLAILNFAPACLLRKSRAASLRDLGSRGFSARPGILKKNAADQGPSSLRQLLSDWCPRARQSGSGQIEIAYPMSQYVKEFGRARALAAEIAVGRITSRELVDRALARITEVDDAVQAWTAVLTNEARVAAHTLDSERQSGHLRGPLHGIPIAVKDVIDVVGLQTRANCPARWHIPPAAADATVVARLRAAGAIILGKTHTTELAYFESVPPTRNPHDLLRTPGGSSAGSAAAVACGAVPLALGTQTAGSVSRPAAYCGIGAFKPSTLALVGVGVIQTAPSFDTVGAFGSSAADAALLTYCAMDHLRFGDDARADSRIVVLRDPLLDRADAETRAVVTALSNHLKESGLPTEERDAPVPLEDLRHEHGVVMLAELGRYNSHLPPDQLAPRLAEAIQDGLAIPDTRYHHALRALAAMRSRWWASFRQAEFAFLPAAPSVAPVGVATGDPAFASPITALGGPIASIRAGRGKHSGMPVGAMLTARPGADARLAAFLWHEADPALDL